MEVIYLFLGEGDESGLHIFHFVLYMCPLKVEISGHMAERLVLVFNVSAVKHFYCRKKLHWS